MDLLRIFTAGNVDDGKSTLIGRLLNDCNLILKDQMQAIEKASASRGLDEANLALITDGLKDERDQGITIDVAYRYFATPKRKFILADTPGHVQYTRNMVTGASTANLAIVLIDARHGLQEQTRRHCFIASLLRIPHLVICVNKMDLVDYSQEVFEKIKEDFEAFSGKLEIVDVNYMPVSALKGDNIVSPSKNMRWFKGRPLLDYLESVHIASDRNLIDSRLPIQSVIRIHDEYGDQKRAFAGSIASGYLKKGDSIVVLPSGFESKIKKIEVFGKEVEEARAPMAVSVFLENEIDIQRGDMICRSNNRPQSTQDISAMICWMSESPMALNRKYQIRHTTNTAQAMISQVLYKVDVNSLSKDEGHSDLKLNDIGRVTLKTSSPLLADRYRSNRATGSFIIVDDSTKSTLGAGMIV